MPHTPTPRAASASANQVFKAVNSVSWSFFHSFSSVSVTKYVSSSASARFTSSFLAIFFADVPTLLALPSFTTHSVKYDERISFSRIHTLDKEVLAIEDSKASAVTFRSARWKQLCQRRCTLRCQKLNTCYDLFVMSTLPRFYLKSHLFSRTALTTEVVSSLLYKHPGDSRRQCVSLEVTVEDLLAKRAIQVWRNGCFSMSSTDSSLYNCSQSWSDGTKKNYQAFISCSLKNGWVFTPRKILFQTFMAIWTVDKILTYRRFETHVQIVLSHADTY